MAATMERPEKIALVPVFWLHLEDCPTRIYPKRIIKKDLIMFNYLVMNTLINYSSGNKKYVKAKLLFDPELEHYISISDKTKFNQILLNAITKPFIQILKNAGIDKYHAILAAVEHDFKGYNIKTQTYVDMVEEGIIDPTKVTRTALENAVSVAGTMLITECTIVDDPKEKEEINYNHEIALILQENQKNLEK